MSDDLMKIDINSVTDWFDGMMESKRKTILTYYKNPKIAEKYIQSAKQIFRSNAILKEFTGINNGVDRNYFAKTMFEAIDQVARHNLTLGTMAQHVDIHVISEASERDDKGKPIKWRKVVYCSLQYQGQLELCYRNPKVKAVKATVVRKREGEKFIWNGIDKAPLHEIDINALEKTGKIIGAWAFAELDNGAKTYEFMDLAALDQVKSIVKPSSTAFTWEEEWAKKVVLRRLTKSLPKTREQQEWEEWDNQDYNLKQLPTQTPKINKIQAALEGK